MPMIRAKPSPSSSSSCVLRLQVLCLPPIKQWIPDDEPDLAWFNRPRSPSNPGPEGIDQLVLRSLPDLRSSSDEGGEGVSPILSDQEILSRKKTQKDAKNSGENERKIFWGGSELCDGLRGVGKMPPPLEILSLLPSAYIYVHLRFKSSVFLLELTVLGVPPVMIITQPLPK